MHEHEIDHEMLVWFLGWLVAVVVLFAAGLRLPLETHYGRLRSWLYGAGCVLAGIGVWVLANAALVLHDSHFDFTREKVYTPSATAMRVADDLTVPVRVTYFFHSLSEEGRRTAELLAVMGRRNPLLTVTAVDPDKQPELARREGIRLYNAAVIEAEGRRVLVQGTDEAEVAIGIQRVLRQRAITVCFVEGHGELPMDAFEFHTHLEGVSDHNHGDAASKVVETAGHGIGRLRRALEAQGYETRKLVTATGPDIPAACSLVVVANPRTLFLPAESAALRGYLGNGGSALLMFDLGFVLEPELARLVGDLGVDFAQEVVVDPLSHYQSDPEMVAVSGYDPHPITRTVSMTFYPGVRPLLLRQPAPGVTATPLMLSSRDSYARPVEPAAVRQVEAAPAAAGTIAQPGPRVLGVVAEGTLPGGAAPFRAMLVGDADFASNSFLPYLANSDLLVAAVRWLAREDRATAVRTRIPVPPTVLLTAAQTRAVFFGIVILLPLSVVAAGCIVWWRRR